MGGLLGYRPSIFTKRKHAGRLEPNGKLWTEEEVQVERLAGMYFGALCERQRQPFSLEAAEFFANAGFPIPMSLWPTEWWAEVRRRDCPDDWTSDFIVPGSEEAFIAEGRGDRF